MCGICGVLTFGEGAVREHEPEIRKLTAMMRRRGPDDDGFWSDGKRAAFGFRRLSVLDLSSAARQPMLTPDGRHALVFNGEVYNFRELRAELEARGVRFRSSGDTAVVLHALAAWGREALDRFNGMFALAFYDSAAKKLLLARDHAGVKPLYYLVNSEGVLFASQYDQIMAHPWGARESVSPEALGLYLRFGYIPPPYALFTHTHLVRPGSWIEVDDGGKVGEGRFFEFPRFREPDLTGGEAYEAVDEAVTRAVRRQLVSDVPVGAFLSGGIDSPLVVSRMRRAGASGLKAFTIGTQGDPLDESGDAARYAGEIGVEHVVRHFEPGRCLTMLEDAAASCGEPFADYSLFPTMLAAGLAREHGLKVMLSGDGGDELFWGYAERSGRVIAAAEDFRRPYWLRAARVRLTELCGRGGAYPALKRRSIGDWYRARHTRTSEETLRAVFPGAPPLPESFAAYDFQGGGEDRTAQWIRWNEYEYHLGMVLMKVDRASMFHSVEVRVPLLDREVIETACRVDWSSCLDLGKIEGKLPLRRALSRDVRFQTSGKRGFEVPMGEWLKGPLKEIFEGNLLSRDSLCGLALDARALEKLYRDFCAGRTDVKRALWTILSLALWERKHRPCT